MYLKLNNSKTVKERKTLAVTFGKGTEDFIIAVGRGYLVYSNQRHGRPFYKGPSKGPEIQVMQWKSSQNGKVLRKFINGDSRAPEIIFW
jgi:hypothetical protein